MQNFLSNLLVFVYSIFKLFGSFVVSLIVGIYMYDFIRPKGALYVSIFIIIWFVFCFLIYGFSFLLIKKLRHNNKSFDRYIDRIEKLSEEKGTNS